MPPPGGPDEPMHQRGVEVSPFDMGRIFQGLSNLEARLDEVKRDTAVTLEKLEQRIEGRMTQFADSLQKLADGYVRREDMAECKKDIDALGSKHRDLEARVGALEIQGGRSEPVLKALWDVGKYVVIAGLGAAGQRFLGH